MSKHRFKSGSAKLEEVRNAPPPGPRAQTEKGQNPNQELMDWLELKASLAVDDECFLVFCLCPLEACAVEAEILVCSCRPPQCESYIRCTASWFNLAQGTAPNAGQVFCTVSYTFRRTNPVPSLCPAFFQSHCLLSFHFALLSFCPVLGQKVCLFCRNNKCLISHSSELWGEFNLQMFVRGDSGDSPHWQV